jgi:ferredoxin--NADP+ reductase
MRNYKIAIVGAGPAGYYAAQALQNSQNEELSILIDMFEKLPTPWGLVRSGVAPDHPKIKSVAKVFDKIACEDNFRLFANVELGKDVSIDELKANYDAVVIAIGSSVGKKLGIPGEDLIGSISSSEYVPWYNGHPDFANLDVPLDTHTAVVIGAGNVAMDVARSLGLDPDEFEKTDMATYAISALHDSKIREVHICARRAPEHAAFTAPEIRELPHYEKTSISINSENISAALGRTKSLGDEAKDINTILAAMLAIAEEDKPKQERSINFHFLLTPIEIKGEKRVEEIVFKVNEVSDGKVISTDKTFSIKCGLVITAIGYNTAGIEGLEIENGKVKNTDGRVVDGVYVVGWAKRGPSGVIGTNKSDSTEVMQTLITDLGEPKDPSDFEAVLKQRGIKYVNQRDWTKINDAEVTAGEQLGKPRLKITSREEMLNLL